MAVLLQPATTSYKRRSQVPTNDASCRQLPAAVADTSDPSARRCQHPCRAPRVMDMAQLDAAGFKLSHLPGHDGSRCYALAVDQRRSSVQLNEHLEGLAHELQVASFVGWHALCGCCEAAAPAGAVLSLPWLLPLALQPMLLAHVRLYAS
jgi:hypothetical protein